MIQLTRLNKSRLAVNSDLIKYVEQAHDTVITLINGEKLVVRESPEQVIKRVLYFRKRILAGLRVVCSSCAYESAADDSWELDTGSQDLDPDPDYKGQPRGQE